MSETRTNISEHLVGINVPNLNEAGYAEQLSKTFADINTNFIKLSNRDFIKGENGDSVKIQEVNLVDNNGLLTEFGNKLISAIENNSDENERADITLDNGTILSWMDYFNANPGKLYVIYYATAVTTDTDVAYSSLYYTFLDGRYVNSYIGKIEPKEYQLIKDLSCILVYDKDLNNGDGGFNIISNAFPTIYYEEGIGLCWKVNGANTGIPVQGIPGKDGTNTSMYVVQSIISPSTGLGDASDGDVTKIFEPYYGFKEIDSTINIYKYNDSPALILAENIDSLKPGKEFYIGVLKVENIDGIDKLRVYCSPSASISSGINTEAFINAMKSIDINGTSDAATSTPKGLFIPMSDENKATANQPVHLMSATSITNNENSSDDIKTDLIFTPIKSYNDLDINTSANDSNILVDKYLYVKLNLNNNTIMDNNINPLYNGVLKYKLESTVFYRYKSDDTETDDFMPFRGNNFSVAVRYFGPDRLNPGKNFNDDIVAYINPSNGDKVINHFDSMPEEFKVRLKDKKDADKPVGIYKWILCNKPSDWDVDELLEAKNNSSVENFTYSFSPIFNTIYTTDITPGANTTFMWFDGYTYVSDSYRHNIDKNNSDLFFEDRSIIRGWNPTDNYMFSFIKFVPVYINNFAVNNDTSLNLNYNVNITGDALNPNKSITVHGNVNCDNLNVYKLTATGAIQNIYTEDQITGARGIKLCEDKSGYNQYNFIVEDGGDVIARNGIRSTSVNCTPLKYENEDWTSEVYSEEGTVTAVHVKSDDIKINEFTVYSDEIDGTVNIKNNTFEIGQDTKKNTFEGINIDITKTSNINIDSVILGYGDKINSESFKVGEDYNSKVPVITSNMPTHLNDNANIIVSNQPNGSDMIYYRDVKRDVTSIKPAGDGVTMGTIDFDSAKNFNINRFYANSTGSNSIKIIKKGSGPGTSLNGNPPGENSSLFLETYSSTVGEAKQSFTGQITNETISKVAIQKYLIEPNGNIISIDGKTYNVNKIDPSTDINITFKKPFLVQAAIRGCCSNGKCPVLLNTNSFIELSLWIRTAGKSPQKLGTLNRYRFSNANGNDNWDDNNNKDWIGHDNTGKSFSKENYNMNWRYYTYMLSPYNIKLSKAQISGILTEIEKSSSTIELFIVAEGSLHARGQRRDWPNKDKSREVISGLWLGIPRPINATKPSENTTMNVINGQKINFESPIDLEASNLELKYLTEGKTSNEVKSTVICNDGLVTRAGDYTFGLGYATHYADHLGSSTGGQYTKKNGLWDHNYITTDKPEPVLFYYDAKQFANDYNSTPEDLANDKIGYARRVNTIRLTELFETIKLLRSNENYIYGI